MFDIGFSEILVIFILALIVLGPEKLPRVVREVGRWVGRARAMARQFQEQLEEEVDADRSRTTRPEPVRPVGGVPPASPPPVTSEPTGEGPEHTEPVPSIAAPWQTADSPLTEAAASSGDPPPEPLTPGSHEPGT
ncbi:MAG TPA: Sec-independent protein translocase protein TatB [Steroidobacteraceae bacterium]|nr:Sec-independent protein translocase protein TatB [Steroidobacteraceae bacterium]